VITNPSKLFLFLGLTAAIAFEVIACASVVHAQASVAVVYSFQGGATDGAFPFGGVIQASDGNLYGTTHGGGPNNFGTVFRMASDGTGSTPLYIFTGGSTDGYYPEAGLIQASDGAMYGTTNRGGSGNFGTVFRITPDGSSYTPLLSFSYSNGAYPLSALIQGSDGTLYGTTGAGDVGYNGTVFQMSLDGVAYTVLHGFGQGTDGSQPWASLMQGTDGMLYGTTFHSGGPPSAGTVFRIAPDGSGYTILHTFNYSDGGFPQGRLIQASDGLLYGTTQGGGIGNSGTIFRMAPDGSGFTVLHSFFYSEGYQPHAGVFQANDGLLYGTTYNGGDYDFGTIFRMAPDGTGFTVLHGFTGGTTDGGNPSGDLIQASDGAIYGTAEDGGTFFDGTVFRLTLSPSSAGR